MKHIHKGAAPESLAGWIAKGNEDWKPEYSDLPKNIKNTVKEALMTEQGWLCCYCERSLTDEDSHIEHFRPQSNPDVDPLDFSNMLCSCQNLLKKGEPRHCGHLKEDWFDPDLLVSPLQPDCECQFAFSGRGEIMPAANHDRAACETIARLGLNIAKLQALRNKAIEPFLDDNLKTEDLRKFVTGYLDRDDAGKFGQFHTTIKYLFGNFITSNNKKNLQ